MSSRIVSPGQPPKPRYVFHFLLLAFGILVGFAVAELAVRGVGYADEDGNFWVRGRRLPPHRLPVRRHAATTRNLDSVAYLQGNPLTGWSIRPGGRTSGGLFYANADGIRTGSDRPDYTPRASAGITRILLLGDSFTHGDGVRWEETWAYQLKRELNDRGQQVEVINLGVGGFGIDQSVLRWRALGRRFSPDLVIFGLQMENIFRNLTLIRILYYIHTEIPFTKPRFVLDGDSGLRVINQPVLSAHDLQVRLRQGTLMDWEPIRYERYLSPYLEAERLWRRSRLLGFIESFGYRLEVPSWQEVGADPRGSEAGRLALELLSLLEKEVTETGARFLVAHLATEDLLGERPPPYVALLAEVIERHDVVDTVAELEQAQDNFALFRRGHYTPNANREVARLIAKHLAH